MPKRIGIEVPEEDFKKIRERAVEVQEADFEFHVSNIIKHILGSIESSYSFVGTEEICVIEEGKIRFRFPK